MAAWFPMRVCAQNTEKQTAADICQEANAYYDREQYALAMTRYIDGMEAAEKEQDMQTYMVCTGCVANIYEAIGDYDADIIYLFKGYDVAVKVGSQNFKSIYLSNIVAAYCRLGYAGLARKYYQLQVATPCTNDTTEWRYFLIYNQARILQAEGRFDHAIAVHRKARSFVEQRGMDSIYAVYQTCEIGNIMLKKADYDQALACGYESYRDDCRLHNKELQVTALDILSNAYRSGVSPDSANKYHNLYLTMSDSVFNARNFYKARNNMLQYESRKNSQHINLLHTIIDKQYLVITAISLLFALSLLLLLLLYYKHRNLRDTQRLLIAKHKEIERANLRNSQLNECPYPSGEGTESSTSALAQDESLPLSKQQQEQLLRRIVQVMSDSTLICNPDFSLERLAHIVDSNRTYVSLVINNTYNKNFKSLLNEYRIREACKRLSDKEHYGNITIQAVYEEVGYTNAASFIRAFKKEMGMNPSVYQKLEEDGRAGRGAAMGEEAE